MRERREKSVFPSSSYVCRREEGEHLWQGIWSKRNSRRLTLTAASSRKHAFWCQTRETREKESIANIEGDWLIEQNTRRRRRGREEYSVLFDECNLRASKNKYFLTTNTASSFLWTGIHKKKCSSSLLVFMVSSGLIQRQISWETQPTVPEKADQTSWKRNRNDSFPVIKRGDWKKKNSHEMKSCNIFRWKILRVEGVIPLKSDYDDKMLRKKVNLSYPHQHLTTMIPKEKYTLKL